jgi:hypothetical protein
MDKQDIIDGLKNVLNMAELYASTTPSVKDDYAIKFLKIALRIYEKTQGTASSD